MSDFYTVQEVAEKLKVSVQSVNGLIKGNQLKTVRIGTLVRVPVSALEDFAKSAGKAPPKKAPTEKQTAAREAFKARVQAKSKPATAAKPVNGGAPKPTAQTVAAK